VKFRPASSKLLITSATPFAAVLHVQPQVTLDERIILSQTGADRRAGGVTKQELVVIASTNTSKVLSVQFRSRKKS